MHILVLDDNADIIRMLRIPLEAEGYRVSTASDGQAALTLLAREVPDLIVSDVMMPGADGFALVEEMRRDPRLMGVPALGLSVFLPGDGGRVHAVADQGPVSVEVRVLADPDPAVHLRLEHLRAGETRVFFLDRS